MPEPITRRIATVRGLRVLRGSDLAALDEVECKRFNKAVRRNLGKFPGDFMFTLTAAKVGAWRSPLATSNDQIP